jgi:hypothetical protein
VAQDGVEISASTLRYAMQRAAKEDKSAQAEKNATAHVTTALNRAKRANQARSSQSGNIRAEHRQDGGTVVSKSGSMVIRDAFSFEITPDTENL